MEGSYNEHSLEEIKTLSILERLNEKPVSRYSSSSSNDNFSVSNYKYRSRNSSNISNLNKNQLFNKDNLNMDRCKSNLKYNLKRQNT